MITLLKRFLSVLVLMLAWPAASLALEHGPYSIEILVDGTTVEEHGARGTTYIQALEGREYSIRLRNHTGERIAVALAVDGLNSIDAKATTARKASKWILGPYDTVTIDGWQTSSQTARRFFFTTEDHSYGAWLGKTKNLGIISAAVFREKRPQPTPIQREDARLRQQPMRGRAGEAQAPGAPAEAGARAEPNPTLSDEMAATGIGRELGHRVRRARFEAEASPAAVMELRYEYHDALVRLGVLPRPRVWCDTLDRREDAHGFEPTGFAPDPFRR